MNFRQMAGIEIDRWRPMQRQGWLILGGALGVAIAGQMLVLTGIDMRWLEAGSILLSMVALYGFWLLLLVFLRIRNTFRCPQCDKKLGYLLLDPSYSKNSFSTAYTPEFPAAIQECPYCKLDFDAELIDAATN